MGTVNNYDVMNEIAIRHGLSRAKAAAIYDDFVALIRAYLHDGHSVVLNRFALFEVVHRGERSARNPRTGETFIAPPKDVVKIRTRKLLHDLSDAAPLPELDGDEGEKLRALYENWIDPKLRGETDEGDSDD